VNDIFFLQIVEEVFELQNVDLVITFFDNRSPEPAAIFYYLLHQGWKKGKFWQWASGKPHVFILFCVGCFSILTLPS
jgi:hypothetical protein